MSETINPVTQVMGEEINSSPVDNGTPNSQEKESNLNNSNFADQANAEEDYLGKFVGEGKPYNSVEDAAKALAKKALHADEFIETLKREKQELEQKASEGKTVDEILKALRNEGNTGEESFVAPTSAASEDTPNEKGFTVDELETWYSEREQKRVNEEAATKEVEKIKGNQAKAWELLASEDGGFGSIENAKRAVASYIGDDQAKAEVINRLGGYNPEDLLPFLKATVKQDRVNFSDDVGTVNISGNTYGSPQKWSWDFVKKMEKENPKLRKDRKWLAKVSQNISN